MKKILLWIFCIIIFLGVFVEQSEASVAFFTTKDGKVFCESDSFDGSYRICTKEQSTGTGLVKAERYNARLVDTTAGRICVEDGTEVDMTLCQEEIDALNSISVQTGSTPTVPPVVTNTATVSQGVPPVTTTPTPSPDTQNSLSGGVNPAQAPVAQQVIITEDGLIASIQLVFSSCIGSTGKVSCGKAIAKFTDTFTKMSTLSIISIIAVFLGCTIFWFNMISHAFTHPIPIKPMWIAILIILSIPGAILYYFGALRPYEAMIIASSPPRPPSFFY